MRLRNLSASVYLRLRFWDYSNKSSHGQQMLNRHILYFLKITVILIIFPPLAQNIEASFKLILGRTTTPVTSARIILPENFVAQSPAQLAIQNLPQNLAITNLAAVYHHDERFHVSICSDLIERARKYSERSIIDMLSLIGRFERYFPERQRKEHKESSSLSLYPFFTFLLTTDIVFVPFVDPFPNLSLSFLGHIMQVDSSAH